MSLPKRLLRQLSLRQLQIFKTVIESGGHTAAARKLHLTQPTVSMQLKKLQDSLGQPLMEQIGRKLHPTATGQALYQACCDILERLEQLESETSASGEIAGPLRLAVVTSGKYFMPHLLGHFLRAHPAVEPSMVVTNREQVIQHMLDNRADLVIMGRIPGDLPLEAHDFLDNELVFVARSDHPLAREKNLPLARLWQEPFLAREPGSGTRLAVMRQFQRIGMPLQPWLELGSSEAIKQGLLAGLGVSVLSRHNLRLELDTGQLVTLDVQGFPLKRTWFVVHHQGKHLSLAAKAFLEFLRTEARSLLNQSRFLSQTPAAE